MHCSTSTSWQLWSASKQQVIAPMTPKADVVIHHQADNKRWLSHINHTLSASIWNTKIIIIIIP